MFGFSDYILNNYVLIFEIIGLLLLSFISVHISHEAKQMTRIAVIILFAESIVSYIELWTQTFETLSMARVFLTATKYSLYPTVLILIMQIVSPISKNNKVFFSLITIPATISIPFYFTTQWSHIICYYSWNNLYHGGPLKYWPYVVFAFYIVVFLIQNIRYLKNFDHRNRMVVLFILIGSIIGVLIYLFLNTSMDYAPLFTAAILLYYIFTYIYKARTDTLTGLYNRQCFFQDLKSNLVRKRAIISIDMNNLKELNDNHGHLAGDEALRTIADILKDYCGSHGKAYRIGGDEFEIIYSQATEEEIKKNIENMKEELSKTKYSCAFGYAMREVESIYDTIARADERMYEDKKIIKSENNLN